MQQFEIKLSDESVQILTDEASKQGIPLLELLEGVTNAYAKKCDRKNASRKLVEGAVAVARSYPIGTVFTLSKLFPRAEWSAMAPGFKTSLCNSVVKDADFQLMTAYSGQDVSRRETYTRIAIPGAEA